MFSGPTSESWKRTRARLAPVVSLSGEIHERAGLFAWKETAGAFFQWSDEQLNSVMRQAWQAVSLLHVPRADPHFDEFALFDPEFGQWHFVPVLDVMDGAQMAGLM